MFFFFTHSISIPSVTNVKYAIPHTILRLRLKIEGMLMIYDKCLSGQYERTMDKLGTSIGLAVLFAMLFLGLLHALGF